MRNLTTEQIKKILFGAAEEIEEDGVITAHKCTAPIREAWQRLSPAMGVRSLAATGVRLDFETDAKELLFSLSGRAFDCLVDGLLHSRSEETAAGDPKDFSVTLDGNPHRITLIFPSHSDSPSHVGKLHGVALSDGATVTPHRYDEKFLFIGDSITQGWNSGIDSLSYAWRTSLFFNADCIIHGVGGGRFDPSIFEAPKGFDPDRVFIAFGTNDFSHLKTMDEMHKCTVGFLDRLFDAYPDKKIYGITPIYRSDKSESAVGTFDECIAMIREEYEKRNITVIDGLKLVPHLDEFYADPVHPNALGFSVYAENLIKELIG